jgi:carbon starvation protein
VFTEQIAGRTVLHAMPLILGVLCILAIAYRYYSAFLAAKVLALNDANITPAHTLNDGQNYHPTNKWVLFGHHFAAISGAGPLIGPVLALQYGYLPGLLWLVIGVCLAGAVQDMLVLGASVRRGGKSLAEIARTELGPFASGVTSLAILFIVVIALAGLGFVVVKALGGEEVPLRQGMQITLPQGTTFDRAQDQAPLANMIDYYYRFPAECMIRYVADQPPVKRSESLLIHFPKSHSHWKTTDVDGQTVVTLTDGCSQSIPGSSWGTFTIAATIPIALAVGWYMYRIRPGHVFEASVIGAAATLIAVVYGKQVADSDWGPWFSLSRGGITFALCAYGFVASVLPVWLLLAPRDYLSSFLKIGTIALLVLGVVLANPTLPAPAINSEFAAGGPTMRGGLFPFVFICIMCGSISGFHALVSSGTTPKMIDKETQVRAVGYGAMLIEGLVGVVALIAAASLDPKIYYEINVDQRRVAEWQPKLDKLYVELGNADLTHLPVERRDLGQVELLVGGETLRGRTGGAVTLAVGMSFILTDAAKWFMDPAKIKDYVQYWYHFAIMFEALFILTTIDAGTRVARFLLQEAMGKLSPQWGRTDWLPGACFATLVVTAGWGVLVYTGSIDTIWPMFGIANQLLAVLALALVTTLLINSGKGRYAWTTLLPMLFVAATTLTAGAQMVGIQFPQRIRDGDVVKGYLCIALTVAVIATVVTLLLTAMARWVAVWRGIIPVSLDRGQNS